MSRTIRPALERLAALGMRASPGTVGDAHDNALAEILRGLRASMEAGAVHN